MQAHLHLACLDRTRCWEQCLNSNRLNRLCTVRAWRRCCTTHMTVLTACTKCQCWLVLWDVRREVSQCKEAFPTLEGQFRCFAEMQMPKLDGHAELVEYSDTTKEPVLWQDLCRRGSCELVLEVTVGDRLVVISAEFYAAAAVSEHLYQGSPEFFGLDTHAKIKLDSSAAKEIANRAGIGRGRSLETRVLWLQQTVPRRFIELDSAVGRQPGGSWDEDPSSSPSGEAANWLWHRS